MRKIRIIILLMIMLLPFKVGAVGTAGSLSVSCSDTTVKVGESTTCTIKGSSDTPIYGFEGSITYDGEFTLSDFSLKDGFATIGEDITGGSPVTIETYNKNFVTGNFDIVSFKVTVNRKTGDTGNINLTMILKDEAVASAASDTLEWEQRTITLNITETGPVQTTKGLSNLTVTNGSILGRQFNPQDTENTGYTIQLNSSDTEVFGINATAKNTDDSIVCKNGHTNETLTCNNITFITSGGNSDMLIYLIVGSDTAEVTYSISAVKPAPPVEPNSSLSSLTVNGTQATKVDGTSYTITLTDVSSYTINATLTDNVNYKFSAETQNFLSPYTFSGEKEIPIIVIPKDENSGLNSITYILTVKKKASENVNPGDNGNNGNNNEATNPQTGGNAATIIGIMLFVSFIASMYIYNRNLKQNN